MGNGVDGSPPGHGYGSVTRATTIEVVITTPATTASPGPRPERLVPHQPRDHGDQCEGARHPAPLLGRRQRLQLGQRRVGGQTDRPLEADGRQPAADRGEGEDPPDRVRSGGPGSPTPRSRRRRRRPGRPRSTTGPRTSRGCSATTGRRPRRRARGWPPARARRRRGARRRRSWWASSASPTLPGPRAVAGGGARPPNPRHQGRRVDRAPPNRPSPLVPCPRTFAPCHAGQIRRSRRPRRHRSYGCAFLLRPCERRI